jgi:hypothetical protein
MLKIAAIKKEKTIERCNDSGCQTSCILYIYRHREEIMIFKRRF